MFKGFWEKLKRPVVGLSPMDGITDAAFRFITAKYGRPSVIFTEFVSVSGICHGALRLMEDFKYNEIERPIVAQVFGSDPDSFYKTAFVVAALGFDGLDINMGCPDKSVAGKQGAGAALILKPNLAIEIIRAARCGLEDYAKGRDLGDIGLPEAVISYVESINGPADRQRSVLPVSVKTRSGFDKELAEAWTAELLKAAPAVISIHGRTLKQMYTGLSDWEAIGRAVQVARGSGTLILGNGDIQNLTEAREKINRYGVDGVLIGRAALGNPWIFRDGSKPTVAEKLMVLLEQARYFTEELRGKPFESLRKSFSWYCRGFAGAANLRNRLVRSGSYQEAAEAVAQFQPI